MPYTPDQIGPVSIQAYSAKTRGRMALVLIQHGERPGLDETQITVLSPALWHAGRRRVLEMLARGVDLADMRLARIPVDYVGPGEGAADGTALQSARDALWWGARDDCEAEEYDETPQEFAAQLLKEQDGEIPPRRRLPRQGRWFQSAQESPRPGEG